jgi:hypothetical protein
MPVPSIHKRQNRIRLQGILVPDSGKVRVPTDEPCEAVGRQGTREANLWNLSLVGVYLALPPPLPAVGEVLRLTFALPGDPEPIRSDARVAWQNPPSVIIRGLGSVAFALPPGCGLTFLSLDDGDQARIATYLERAQQRRS